MALDELTREAEKETRRNHPRHTLPDQSGLKLKRRFVQELTPVIVLLVLPMIEKSGYIVNNRHIVYSTTREIRTRICTRAEIGERWFFVKSSLLRVKINVSAAIKMGRKVFLGGRLFGGGTASPTTVAWWWAYDPCVIRVSGHALRQTKSCRITLLCESGVCCCCGRIRATN